VIIRKKPLAMLACALMILSGVAAGAIAYLSDHGSVTNTFTVGRVSIVMDETQVDESGSPVPDPAYDPEDSEHNRPYLRTEKGNEYPLVPGSEYVKDPTMTVIAGSERAYVRMVVTISHAKEIDAIFAGLQEDYPDGFDPGAFVTGRDNAAWVRTGTMKKDEEKNTYTLEFRYARAVEPEGAEDEILVPLFGTIRMPGELTNAHLTLLEGFAIEVSGHAVQAAGFDTADDAWAAFEAQEKKDTEAEP